MFYCEQCRVINAWPKGIGQSFGPCEDCGQRRLCYDRPSNSLPRWSEKRSMSLCPLDEPGFSMESLEGRGEFNVHRVVSKADNRVVIEYGSGDLANPKTDPLIIGTVIKDGEYYVRVLWDNKLWRPWDQETDELLGIMEGVDVKGLREFFEKRPK